MSDRADAANTTSNQLNDRQAEQMLSLIEIDNLTSKGIADETKDGVSAVCGSVSYVHEGPIVGPDNFDSLDVSNLQIDGIVLGEIIRAGGMGVVIDGCQPGENERPVAVKVIRPDQLTERLTRRFEIERKLLTGSRHPNVVTVFQTGLFDGGTGEDELRSPYIVMERVDGVALDQYCDAEKLDFQSRMQLMIQVCDGVQALHRSGIAHRDLKPDNILVETVSGRPTPKIIDFGLAVEISPHKSPVDEVSGGTIDYMSPEQFAGGTDASLPPVDIYALGTTLFELVYGGTPSELRSSAGDSTCELDGVANADQNPWNEMFAAMLDRRLAVLVSGSGATQVGVLHRSRLRKLITGPLVWVIEKARHRDPDKRYQSADAMATDLRRLLNHEPVDAGPRSRRYHVACFIKRHAVLVSATAATFVALTAGAGMLLVALERSRDAERMADHARREAVANSRREAEARRESERALALSNVSREQIVAVKDILNQMVVELTVPPSADETTATGSAGGSAEPQAIVRRVGIASDPKAVINRFKNNLVEASRRLALLKESEDAETLELRLGISRLLRAFGDQQNADELIVEVEDQLMRGIDENSLGKQALDLVMVVNAISGGRHDEADRRLARLEQQNATSTSADISERPTFELVVEMFRARQLHAQGDIDKALEITLKIHPENVPTDANRRQFYFSNLANLGTLYFEKQRYDDAVAAFESCVSEFEKTLPAAEPILQDSRANLAIAMRKAGKPEGYLKTMRDIYFTKISINPIDSPAADEAKVDYAVALANTNNDDQALVLFDEVIRRSEGQLATVANRTRARLERADLLFKMGRPLTNEQTNQLRQDILDKVPGGEAILKHYDRRAGMYNEAAKNTDEDVQD